MAKLCNMNYSDPVQKKLVNTICLSLDGDDKWDENDKFEKGFKAAGLKRYKLDKALLGKTKETDTFVEGMTSSSSKDGKGNGAKSISDFDGCKGVDIKIQNPAHVELMTLCKTTKSAAAAMSSIMQQFKTMLPSILTSSSAEGHHF